VGLLDRRRRDAHELPERIGFTGSVEGDLVVVILGRHGAAAPRLESLHGEPDVSEGQLEHQAVHGADPVDGNPQRVGARDPVFE
jgi:hypothetical protein